MIRLETSYGLWMRDEGIPVIEGYGMEDVRAIRRVYETALKEYGVPLRMPAWNYRDL